MRGGSGGGRGSTATAAALVLVVPPCPRNRESGAMRSGEEVPSSCV